MKEQKNGVIVNVIATPEYQDLSGFANAASMVAGFTQSWAKQLTPFNIRVRRHPLCRARGCSLVRYT